MRNIISKSVAIALGIGAVLPSAMATNGMNMEGYGPEATGMGGASMAYDNGTAAMMNNPATIGLMDDNSSRLDAALGSLSPSINTSVGTYGSADSSADQFYMPAVGFATKQGEIGYGFGVFAQGGMGTEYAANSPLAAGSGERVKSQVGVGRILVPVTFDVNNSISVGATLDYVWADMDLMMAMSGYQMGAIADPSGAAGSMGGSMAGSLSTAMTYGIMDPSAGMGSAVNWARFDFQNGDPMRGAAHSDGYGFKLGMVFKMDSKLTLGASFHSETSLDDMTGAANVAFNANIDDNYLGGTWNPGVSGSAAGTYTAMTIPVSGKITVKDFQWPSAIGMGAAFKMSDSIMFAADFKRLMWSDVMDSFKMSFVADSTQANPMAAGYAGQVLDVSMKQNWKDQDIIQLGATFTMSPELVLRAGFNYAENPVPDQYMNPLFPAIVEQHYTGGVGYNLSKDQAVNFSLTYAPEVSATNPGNGSTIPAVTTTHSQTNWQLMYSIGF